MAASRETLSRSHHFSTIRHPKFDVSDRPFIVIWEMTRACDLACEHCRAEAIPARNAAELTTDEARTLIDQIAAFGQPSPIMVFTGGDPMKRPDLAELITYAGTRRVPAAFSPSATPLLTADILRELHSAGLKALSLSLDGASASVHDGFRGIAGVYDRTLAAWEVARGCGLKVQINTTVTRLNLWDLPAIARTVIDRGAMTWSAFFLVPVGRGTTLEQISAEECEDVMHFLYDVGMAIPVKTTEGHHYKRICVERTVLQRLGIPPEQVLKLGPTYHALREKLGPVHARDVMRRSPMDVNSGRGFVFISHTGTVYPSGFLPISAGNVRRTPLNEIYRVGRLFKRLRNPALLGGRCGECEFVGVCGGSRSRAFAMTEDVLAQDPLCNYAPHSFPFQKEVAELFREEARSYAAGEAPPAGRTDLSAKVLNP